MEKTFDLRRFGAATARPRLRSLAILVAAFTLLGPLLLSDDDINAAPVRASAGERSRPNVVVILTDDQRTDSLMSMPSVRSLLVDRGTRFTDAMVPTSICCPSRSAILTGRYSHHTGVWTNGGKHGGWRTFKQNGNERRTIAVAMHRRGYRTALLGKYLNNFGRLAPDDYKPAGWNRFEGFRLPAKSGAYYDYHIGLTGAYGASSQDYSTDVLATRAVDFIWSTPEQRSLFLLFAPFAPHHPFLPAQRDVGSLQGVMPSYQPASLTAPVDDKPFWVRRLTQPSQEQIDHVREGQGEALMAVDDAVGAIVAALEHSGRMRDTLIVFMSDNGLQTGEHHIIGKNVPYQAATSIPLVIRWDGHVGAGRVDHRLALNLDIPATVADAAGAKMSTDGSSLLGHHRRKGFVLESAYSDRYARPAYCGWRTAGWMYVRYTSGEEELYSYRDDPDELHNLAADPSYAARLTALKAKAKDACHPLPPSFHW